MRTVQISPHLPARPPPLCLRQAAHPLPLGTSWTPLPPLPPHHASSQSPPPIRPLPPPPSLPPSPSDPPALSRPGPLPFLIAIFRHASSLYMPLTFMPVGTSLLSEDSLMDMHHALSRNASHSLLYYIAPPVDTTPCSERFFPRALPSFPAISSPLDTDTALHPDHSFLPPARPPSIPQKSASVVKALEAPSLPSLWLAITPAFWYSPTRFSKKFVLP